MGVPNFWVSQIYGMSQIYGCPKFMDTSQIYGCPKFMGVPNLWSKVIRVGNSNIRNPILISYVAKGLLPYHGLGSGIKRALEAWPHIDFIDDQEGCLFTVTVHRKSVEELELAGDSSVKNQDSPKSSPKSSPKTENLILTHISKDSFITTEQLGFVLGISKRAVLRQISKLKVQGRLRRVGSARGGHWEVSD